MDTRGHPGDQPRISPPTERTATGGPDVEIIELTKVPRRSGRSGMVAAIAIVSSLTVLVTAASIRPSGSPDTSPGPPSGAPSGAALATTSPTLQLETPSPTRRPPTPPPPTTAPRTPAPGEWTRSVVAPGEVVIPQGLWSVDGRFLMLAQAGQTEAGGPIWRFHASPDGEHWVTQDAPAAVDALAGGTVIDGRLWFGARLPGLTDADTRWELASTLDGGGWDILGQMQGWGLGHGLGALGRIGDTWVATRYQDGTDETSVELLWSPDGVRWADAPMPVSVNELRSHAGWIVIASLARIGDTLVASGAMGNYEQSIPFTLSSRDGRTWSRGELPARPDTVISGLVCNTDRCLMPGYILEATETYDQFVFVSTDGHAWREAALDLPNPREPAFSQVVATPNGFLATGITIGMAWISQDGVRWRSVWVMPVEHPSWFESLVANGDLAGGSGPIGSEDDRPFFWHGPIPQVAG